MQPKVSFFAREASWGKILTYDCLKKRRRPPANRCPLCLESEETVAHLLLHCTMIRVLWDLLISLFGIYWVMFASIRENLLGWQGSPSSISKEEAKNLEGVLCAFFEVVWRTRNDIIFRYELLCIQRLKVSFVHILWSETKVSFVNGPLLNFLV